jgi:hypothetical protein
MRGSVKGRRGWSVAAVALVALVGAGAVQARLGRDAGGGGGAETPTIASDAAAPAFSGKGEIAPSVASGSGGAASSDIGSSAVVVGAPRVVRRADIHVKVAKDGFGAAFDRVAGLAAANGGFVSSSTTASNNDARSGQLTVRVPSDRFDTVRQALSGLGEVESQSIRGEDVSGQLVDYDARLTSLQAQEDALRVLVGQAKGVGEVLQVQNSLFSVRQQIEQLKAQKANLEQSTSLATLQVSLFEPGALGVVRPVADDSRSLADSFAEAVDGMLAVVGGMIVVVGYLVPLAVLGLLGWGASRVLRRRPAVPAVP